MSRFVARPLVASELLVASMFANVLALAMPLFVIQVLNRYVAHGVDATLATLASGAVIAVLLEFFIRLVRIELARGLSIRPDQEISKAGFAVLTALKAPVLERIPPSHRREILEGVDNIRSAYSATNLVAVVDVPFAFLFIGVLFLLSPQLAGIVAIFAGLSFFVGLFTMGTLRGLSRRLVSEARDRSALLGAALQEIDTVRAFNAAGFMRRAWDAKVGSMQKLYRKIIARQGFVQSLTQGIAALMGISIISVGAIFVVRGELDVGALIGANIIAARAIQPISRFAQLGEVFVKARESMNLLVEFSRLPRELERGSAKREYHGGVELKDLAFAHPNASLPLFESLSLKISPGALVLVTGGNGHGKTTLARLLVGLIEPNRGQILVDGLDLRQVLPEWWRRQVIYLAQEPSFINATIGENIRLLNPDLDFERLNGVVEVAGLKPFIDELPQGLDTPILDNGRTLALGIRRRLALARALTSDGKLVILDEPTEGMDIDGCAVMSAVINDLQKKGRTVVVFSFDPNLINGASHLVDLNSKPIPKVVLKPSVRAPTNERMAKEEA